MTILYWSRWGDGCQCVHQKTQQSITMNIIIIIIKYRILTTRAQFSSTDAESN